MPPDRTSMLGQLQQSARRRLTAAGIETPALDARLIIQHALGMTHEALIASPDRLVDHQQSRHIDVLLARRERREPVSRITGEREFYGRPFLITPDVLDPRPDTETLIDQVVDIARTGFETERPLRLLELGTGSGAIVVTLLAELVSASATATDVSDLALSVARHNAQQLVGLERIDFVETSWFDGICGEYDVIASNPPYISTKAITQLAPEVADYDPLLALDGGRDGLGAYRA
ncbi:MAG: peptide chain release factor N(5)-glutamine methyltransferase, partial [Aestuariivirgaceae bacterium]